MACVCVCIVVSLTGVVSVAGVSVVCVCVAGLSVGFFLAIRWASVTFLWIGFQGWLFG